ncbi:MAG TPA: hypothetical protein ENN56_04120 [Firmicutes bacterium]|nr:hypothetical protein [Bacillota bacterium]
MSARKYLRVAIEDVLLLSLLIPLAVVFQLVLFVAEGYYRLRRSGVLAPSVVIVAVLAFGIRAIRRTKH